MANESPVETFQCTVVTPERAVLDCRARFVAMPAHDGEIGILRDRAPLLVQLGIGVLRVETGGETKVWFIDRGFAQMVDNRLTVLTEQARTASELEKEKVLEELEEAHAMEIHGAEHMYADERLVAIQRAKTQLKVIELG